MTKSLLSKDFFGFLAPNNGFQDSDPQAIYPNWLFSARLGQPRQINVPELRMFAKSCWIQMIENTQRKEIMTIPTDVINVDESDDEEYLSDKKLVNDFLRKVNVNDQDIVDVCVESISDVSGLDSGVWNLIYTLDSYEMREGDILDRYGKPTGNSDMGMFLKPFGQRRLSQVKAVDGGSFLKAVDVYKVTKGFYQYSFKHPFSQPMFFEPPEISYLLLNPMASSVYGFSPLQSVQQVVQLMTDSIRWNKDYFRNNLIPDGIVSLPGVTPDSLKKLKKQWSNKVKGKAHQLLFQNSPATFTPFITSPRDLEFLDGQKWYFHLVFAVYGMSPVEVGFHENVNRSSQEGQERITVKNAIKPYLKLFENHVNKKIIPELLGDENPRIKWVFRPKDHGAEKIEHDQRMDQVDRDLVSINEYRKAIGMPPVEWGDEPVDANLPEDEEKNNGNSKNNGDDGSNNSSSGNKYFKRALEGFLGGNKQS